VPTERRGMSTGVGEKYAPTELQEKGMDDTQQANRPDIDTQMSTPRGWICTVGPTSLQAHKRTELLGKACTQTPANHTVKNVRSSQVTFMRSKQAEWLWCAAMVVHNGLWAELVPSLRITWVRLAVCLICTDAGHGWKLHWASPLDIIV
jgi:hypothetical protein